MLPTMRMSGEVVIEDTLSRRLSPPRINRGDLVSLLSPLEPTKTICKRVIGLPGDTICVHPDKVRMYRNAGFSEREEAERESDVPREKEPHHVLVPEGHIWISGDNIANSRDSSAFGPVPIALVRGKILARVRLPSKWSLVN
jgi:mitochondrial inner membrane protease subunit 1